LRDFRVSDSRRFVTFQVSETVDESPNKGILKTGVLWEEALLISRDNPVDCPDVMGKIAKDLKVYQDAMDGTEIQINFIDGTSFAYRVENQLKVAANLLVCGKGEPEVLRKFDL
jgi:hypothetical protein